MTLDFPGICEWVWKVNGCNIPAIRTLRCNAMDVVNRHLSDQAGAIMELRRFGFTNEGRLQSPALEAEQERIWEAAKHEVGLMLFDAELDASMIMDRHLGIVQSGPEDSDDRQSDGPPAVAKRPAGRRLTTQKPAGQLAKKPAGRRAPVIASTFQKSMAKKLRGIAKKPASRR